MGVTSVTEEENELEHYYAKFKNYMNVQEKCKDVLDYNSFIEWSYQFRNL